MPKKIKEHFYNLFIPHLGNNHRAKLLHHKSLSKFIIILFCLQLGLTLFQRTKPGVLGYASNITVEAIVSLSNQKRSEQGLEQLKFNDVLAASANNKANHMFEYSYWAHDAPDGTSPWYFFRQAGYDYLYAGENLARDFSDSGAVVSAWMASPTHRDNIISGRYNEIGVAVVNGILNGQETTLVVQHFGTSSSVKPIISDESAASVAGVEFEEVTLEPEIALQESEAIIIEEANEKSKVRFSQAPQLITRPNVSTFTITKTVNLTITLLIILTLSVDALVIYKQKTQRRSGKSFVHLLFLSVIAVIILLSTSGKIV